MINTDGTVRRHPKLILYPLIFDVAYFFILFSLCSSLLTRERGSISFQFVIQPLAPSLSHVIDNNLIRDSFNLETLNDISYQTINNDVLTTLTMSAISIIAFAFLSGGYIAMMNHINKHDESSPDIFIKNGLKFLPRLIIVELLFYLPLVIGVSVVLINGILGVIAILIAGIAIIIMRILLVFWEFTIVTQDTDVIEGASIARQHLRDRTSTTVASMFKVIGVHIIAGLALNYSFTPITIAIMLPIYMYMAAAVQYRLFSELASIQAIKNMKETPLT